MQLPDRLAAAWPALNHSVQEQMYRDPFWSERYGERGRKHTLADGDFHLRYLIEAELGGDPTVFTRYALWLRTLLFNHGMCSRHLADHLRLLSDGLAAHAESAGYAAEAAGAVAVLRGGVSALRHADGPAAAIEARRERAGRDHPDDHLLSYLADALAFERTDRLTDYVRYLADHQGRQGRPLTDLLARLEACAASLDDPTARDALQRAQLAIGHAEAP